jgi:hypothetical protein
MSVPTYQSNQNLVLNNAFGSNINNTLVQTTFPVAPSSSQGHYHFTDSSSNALKLLNCSSDKSGGHQFWNSNSTQTPALLLNITRDATFLNTYLKNTTNKLILDMTQNQIFVSNDNNERINIQPNNINIRNRANSDVVLLSPNSVRVGNDGTDNFVGLAQTLISVSDTTNNSKLSSTDLKFNNVSLVSTVSTNTSNIATNTSNIATNTSNIATNTSNIATNTSNISTLTIKQIDTLNVYSSPAIYADGVAPTSVPLSSSNVYSQFGWYFKNLVAGQKINWYFPPNTNQTVGSILGLYLRLFNCSTTSNDNTPFIVIYTKPTGSGDYSSWYHSSMVYILDTTITPTVNTNYTFFKNVSGTCPAPNNYASSLVNMIQSPVNNPRGNYAPDQQILTIAIGSNSASAVNSVEFVMQKLGLMTASGTTEFNVGFQL